VYWGAAGGAAGAAGGGASVGGGSAVFIARGDYVWSRSAEMGRGFWRQLLSTSRSHQNSRATLFFLSSDRYRICLYSHGRLVSSM
jgi:hypothetical protein